MREHQELEAKPSAVENNEKQTTIEINKGNGDNETSGMYYESR